MDGPVSKNLQKLFFYEEPDRASFAVDHSGTLGDFTLIPHMEGSIDYDPGVVKVDPGQGVQHPFDWREQIWGHKAWKLSFKTPLAPTGTLADDGTAAVVGPCAKLLKNVLGDIAIGTGTTVSGDWADGESGDVADASSLEPGMAVAFIINGRLYAREIESVVGSTLTLKVALPSAPLDTETVYAGVTIHLARNPTAFAQFLVMGEEPQDRYIFRGGFGTVQIDLDMTGEGEPMLTFTFEGRAWDYGEDGATDLSLEAFDPEPYADYEPIPDHVGEFLEQQVGVSVAAQTSVKAVSFQLDLDKRAITNPAAEEGLQRWIRVRQNKPAVHGSFTPSFYEDLTRQKHRDDSDDMYLTYQFGTTASSGAVLLTAPTVQYVASPPAEDNDVGVEKTEWEGRLDADAVEATPTDLGVSPARIHIFG